MNLMALCLGACAGALARWALTQALNTPGAWLPWGTLAANLAGGLLAGVALAAFERWPELRKVSALRCEAWRWLHLSAGRSWIRPGGWR